MHIIINRLDEKDVHIQPVSIGAETSFRLPEHRKQQQVLTWLYGRTEMEQDILSVGLGKEEKLSYEAIRRAGASSARELLRENKTSGSLKRIIPWTSHLTAREELRAWAEGWLYGSYQFNKHRGITASKQVTELHLQSNEWPELSLEEMEQTIAEAAIRNEGTSLTRDLVNEAPESLHPEAFVKRVEELFRDAPGVKLHVYQGEELVQHQMNGLIAVGGGSKYKPALVEIQYDGTVHGAVSSNEECQAEPLVLIGKGITFDMGGMNVKTGHDISDARMDMGGAAAIVGAMNILVQTKASVQVTALLAIADNLSGSDAMMPASVVTYPNGMSVQVANTDGEGRLIIADALLHAERIGARKVIDIATLTGNVGAALGLELAGIWGNEELTSELVELGLYNGEKLWPMPLVDEYESELRSDYADLRNIGTGSLAGAITAALFIRHFVADTMKWVHIDMAGTVQYKREYPYAAAGATGYGARLLADYVERQYNA
ncbi:leucyl aminopeptidase family protein [Paenibacillus sp. Marseille-Q4541]|uniref:leucyl aminopeptidase family protein n=1 Tax=Paenibacillus sp. Marseille-Q4541 TaxID=2831522 RepID=UPI001BACA506|nr:leucyl aminopeptidase family protein [Paenibacillus sp. Marseille-Q4541]